MIEKLRQIWPVAVSGIVGFLIAAVLFLPQAYPSNQNIYRIIRDIINVLNQIIGYVNHFYFDSVDMEKIMEDKELVYALKRVTIGLSKLFDDIYP